MVCLFNIFCNYSLGPFCSKLINCFLTLTERSLQKQTQCFRFCLYNYALKRVPNFITGWVVVTSEDFVYENKGQVYN
jgi:hypothetical protein